MKQVYLLLLIISISAQSQFQMNGLVKDFYTHKPLPFASLTTSDGVHFVADINGRFTIVVKNAFKSLEVTYIGYIKKTIVVQSNNQTLIIPLLQKFDNLDEVVIKQKNNALSVIKKVIVNKTNNNPKEKLITFEFNSYNKVLVTADSDSISGQLDSIFDTKSSTRRLIKVDSTNYKFKEVIKKRHLFQTEKVSFTQFANNNFKETILGTKMSGFTKPVYEVLGFNLQSFSIYDSSYELFQTKYKNPITKNAYKEYEYQLLDTIAVKGRDSYMIYFKNKNKKKTAGLEGVLYIDLKTFAICKAVFRTRGILDISAIDEFEYLQDERIWFPIQKVVKISKGENDEDIKILGGTIQFNKKEETRISKKTATDYTYLISSTSNFDIKCNRFVTINKLASTLEIKEEAIQRPDSFWKIFRKDSLDSRELQTYIAMDSLVKKKKLESKLRFGRKIINGFIPLPYFDVDLRKILSFNNYEGFRLGFGGRTNERFSKNFRIEGYAAYGTKDGALKYQLELANRIDKLSDTWFGIAYTDDVKEIASNSYAVEKSPFKIYDARPINISTFYSYISWKTFLETELIPKTNAIFEIERSSVIPKFDYIYLANGKSYSQYNMTTAMISLQWSPLSKFMQTPSGSTEIEKRYPKFSFQYTQSLPKMWENDFDFSRFDFKTEFEKKHLNGQKTSVLFESGYTLGNLPLTHLYNTSPNNLTKENIIERITFGAKNSFETMFFNEFFSSEYIYLQLKHGFKRVKLFNQVKPSLVFVSRMAWGDLQKPEQHQGVVYKTLNKGYFESGIELNQIIKGFGLTGFYRYGPNQRLRFQDNVAIKLSFILTLGF